MTPSQIGVTLRDSHGIPQVRFVTGNKILRILKSNGALLLFILSAYSYTPLFFAFFIIIFSTLANFFLHSYALFPHTFCLGTGLGPSVPEDLWHLIKKAVAVRKHLEVNRKDKDSKFRLILIESRIHRLTRYYKTKQQLPPTFKYDAATASTIIA